MNRSCTRPGEFASSPAPGPPPERVTVVGEVLSQHGLTEREDLAVFVAIGEAWGLFWDPVPPPGTTEREIRRQAQRAASERETLAPWVEALLGLSSPADPAVRRMLRLEDGERLPRDPALRRQWVESVTYQVVRGRRIMPIRSHRGRRPEHEITRAVQACYRYLKERRPAMSAKARRHCIAGVLLAMSGQTGPSMDEADAQSGTSLRERTADAVRMRLERAQPLDEVGYGLLRWCVARMHDPRTPFPYTRRVPVWLYPTADGRIDSEVITEPPGGLGNTFRCLLGQAIQDRLAAGPIREPESLWVEVPAFQE